MTIAPAAASAALHWLPAPELAPREFQPTVEGLGTLLEWLGREGFDGAVSTAGSGHDLVLLLIRGVLIGASVRGQSSGSVIQGPDALTLFVERIGADAAVHVSLLAYARPVAECLAAALDPQPTVRPLTGTEVLRETLRELGAVGHHGTVDLCVGQRWGRILFQHGRPLGAYDSESRELAPSLAGIGRLAALGSGTMAIHAVPRGVLPRLRWPTPGRPGAPRAGATDSPADEARDDRIETNLLWLLSHVERDRDRAEQGGQAEPRVLQVLASFTNAMYSFGQHLAPGSARGLQPPSLANEIAALRPRLPLVDELELKNGEIDAPALAKRYRSLPKTEGYAAEFYREVVLALLALTQVAASAVLSEIGQPSVRQRCATAIETWLHSQEAALPSQQGPSQPEAGG